MHLSPRHMVQRRFSTTAAALAIISLILGSAGVLSALLLDRRAEPSVTWQSMPPQDVGATSFR
ncbi:hypothetical protein AB4099_26080 [Bosea sp. 2KB_26]|uniref:hypothetical protein n=1 Tax=Bosea sp. 2KB_26 TaxID=3237475 RepID=UPI000DE547FA